MSKTSFFKQSGTNNVGTSGNDATDPTEIADTASDSSFFKQSGVNSEVNSNLTQRATDAETAKTAAEAAQASAETAATNAAASETAAQSSANSASTSSSTAATSATTATTKASEASTSASNASSSASAAATSASNASTSETNAATSATTASTAATSAQTAQTAAETAKTAAETAKTAAETAKTSAETAETNSASAATSASNSATTATTQASTATTKASEAATSATNAATSATNASTSATASSNSASSAASAQTAAEAARDSALTALDNFDDRYLGSKTSDPTVDNDGNALVGGSLFFDSTNGIMKVYTGSAWVAAYASTAGTLLVANNLSDVQSAATSRTNLGLSTVAATGAYSDLTGKPSLFDGAFSSLSGKPTTISGYGITDAFDGAFSSLSGKPTTISGYGITDAFDGAFSSLSGKPTTISGYGITDAFDGAFSSLSGKPTTIAGYGITDALQLGTTSTTALAGNTSIPSTLTDLGISDGSANQVLSTNGSGTFTFVNQSAGGGGATQDADGDTKIQVEEGTDDDTIRFDTAGSERMVITNTGLVGLGTTSPSSFFSGADQLVVSGGTGDGGITIDAGTSSASRIHFADGTSGSEAYRGYVVYNHANDSLQIATSGSEAMRINSSNNVGIATSDLGIEGLTVAKVGSASYAAIQLQGGSDGASKGGQITMAQKDDSSTSWNALSGWDNGTHRTVYVGGGNFGQEEATKVQIYAGAYDSGSGGATARLTVDSSKVSINYSGADCLDFTASSTNDSRGIAFNGKTALSADGVDGWLRLNQNSEFSNGVYTPYPFRADGTIVAADKLNVGTSSSLNSTGQLNLYRSANPFIAWYSGSSTRGGYLQYLSDYFFFGDVSYSQSAGSFRAPIFYDSDNTSYYTNPASTSYLSYIGRRSHQTGHLVGGYNNIGNSSNYSNPIFTIGSNYNPGSTSLSNMYGIGYCKNTASFISLSNEGSGWGLYVAADGDARIWMNGSTGSYSGTGNITAYASDRRLKTNIKPIENALDKLNKINGVTYDWVDDITTEYGFHPQCMHEHGVVAQEIAEVLPDAVVTAPFNGSYTEKCGTDHDFKTVHKEKIIPLLIEAIKELQQEVKELKGEA